MTRKSSVFLTGVLAVAVAIAAALGRYPVRPDQQAEAEAAVKALSADDAQRYQQNMISLRQGPWDQLFHYRW